MDFSRERTVALTADLLFLVSVASLFAPLFLNSRHYMAVCLPASLCLLGLLCHFRTLSNKLSTLGALTACVCCVFGFAYGLTV